MFNKLKNLLDKYENKINLGESTKTPNTNNYSILFLIQYNFYF